MVDAELVGDVRCFRMLQRGDTDVGVMGVDGVEIAHALPMLLAVVGGIVNCAG